jgi:hypothetical protein
MLKKEDEVAVLRCVLLRHACFQLGDLLSRARESLNKTEFQTRALNHPSPPHGTSLCIAEEAFGGFTWQLYLVTPTSAGRIKCYPFSVAEFS